MYDVYDVYRSLSMSFLFLSHSLVEIPSTKNSDFSSLCFICEHLEICNVILVILGRALGAGVEVSTVAEAFNLDPEVVEEVNRVQAPGVWSRNRNCSEDFECAWFVGLALGNS